MMRSPEFYARKRREREMEDDRKNREYAQFLVHRVATEKRRLANVNHEEMAMERMPYHARQDVLNEAEKHEREAEAWAWVEKVVAEAVEKGA